MEVASAETIGEAHALFQRTEGHALDLDHQGTAVDATTIGVIVVGTAAIMTSPVLEAEEGVIAVTVDVSAAVTTRAMRRKMVSLKTERLSLTMSMVQMMETITVTETVADRMMSWTALTALIKLQTTMMTTTDLLSRIRMTPMWSTMMQMAIQSSLLRAKWKTKTESSSNLVCIRRKMQKKKVKCFIKIFMSRNQIFIAHKN